MVVPLGYARQTDIPIKAFTERKYAISFVGSVKQRAYNPLSIRALLGTPKDIARSRMLHELQKLLPEINGEVFSSDSGYYLDGVQSDGAWYSEVMADTKICLAPRGSSTETFRLFEALRYGCIVICDRLPRHWFFSDCPIIQLDDWVDLKTEVVKLLDDEERLLNLHYASLAWWEKRCTEKAIAEAMSEALYST